MGAESRGLPTGICLDAERLKALSAASTDSYAYGINNSGTVVGTTYVQRDGARNHLERIGRHRSGGEFVRDGDQ